MAPDPDGTLRSVPLLIEYRGEVYPSLALAALIRARGETAITLDSATGAAPLIKVAGREIPTDSHGNMLVRFRGAGHGYDYLSAAAVLEGRVPASTLAGRIAFVGTTAAGLKELRATPFDPVYPGPEVHAAALDTLLQGDFLQRPRAGHGWELLTALFAGALATLVLSRAGAIAGLPLLFLGSAALWGGSFWLFSREGVFLSPLIPQSVLAGTFALLSFLRFRQGEREAAAFFRRLTATQDVIIHGHGRARRDARHRRPGDTSSAPATTSDCSPELLRDHPRFRGVLDDQTIELMFRLAPMHDIGKVGVRDQILLKPALLTLQEFEEMKRHTVYGDNTLKIAEHGLGDDSFLRIAREFALTHQEKWDGSGYPKGLKGEQIPVVRAPDGRGRRLRRAREPPQVQGTAVARAGRRDPGGRQGHALRPGRARRLPRAPGACSRRSRRGSPIRRVPGRPPRRRRLPLIDHPEVPGWHRV